MKKINISRIFDKVIGFVFDFLMLVVLLALIIGVVKVFIDLRSLLIVSSISQSFDIIVTDVLSLFVVVELFKSLLYYNEGHRLKLTYIVDATLVFILREVLIGLYEHSLKPLEMLALGGLILVLGILRTAAIIYSPKEVKMEELLSDQRGGK